jgi:hypothetical protein
VHHAVRSALVVKELPPTAHHASLLCSLSREHVFSAHRDSFLTMEFVRSVRRAVFPASKTRHVRNAVQLTLYKTLPAFPNVLPGHSPTAILAKVVTPNASHVMELLTTVHRV